MARTVPAGHRITALPSRSTSTGTAGWDRATSAGGDADPAEVGLAAQRPVEARDALDATEQGRRLGDPDLAGLRDGGLHHVLEDRVALGVGARHERLLVQRADLGDGVAARV